MITQFKNLKGIKPPPVALVGKKIAIEEVLNKIIIVHHYRVKQSKFYESGQCIYIQISFENEKRVLFTGSYGLLHYLEQIQPDQFPVEATIIKDNKWFHFK